MKIKDLKVGEIVENYRIGQLWRITQIGGYHGDEISFDVIARRPGFGVMIVRRRLMTFKQFERLKFMRREGDRV